MAFGGFDQDGFVDLVLGNYNGPKKNQILLNKGGGTFLEEGVIDLPTGIANSNTWAIGVAEKLKMRLKAIMERQRLCRTAVDEIASNENNAATPTLPTK
jgi:hypothetical protein